ncbi:hypothetical protein [Nosocomiicoccus sp. HMSC09A07]|uniref:hypothetical protein n=1 Tax=Nosocomiicoccus sp. HMSC09A07 TaxID=1581145 RepID=UPI0008A27FA2|nr:hypothetical protein [Nosocomiicoccus sp. HMSC09A07]OFS64726.1 hypothetical protein HMPREF3177_00040 [Nosocomiicoccus sp. HMSC09A07]
MKKRNRVFFYFDEDELNEVDNHIDKNKSSYSSRTQFLKKAINNQIKIDNGEDSYSDLKMLSDDVKKLKSLLELNLQFTYSIMDRQDLKIVDLYYGGTLSAIKGREAIDFYYRNKKMNENKNHKTVTENNKEEVEEKEINPRWRITDL